jgi:hypothetical protein
MSLAIVGCMRNLHTPTTNDCVIASNAEQSSEDEYTDVIVATEIHDIQWSGEQPPTPPTFPIPLEETFRAHYSYQSILGQLDILQIWDQSQTEQGARDAIDTEVRNFIEVGATTEGNVLQYIIGHKFLETARTWGFGSRPDLARVLIESCARIIIDQPKNSVESFRQSSSPHSEQITREDGAMGFRTHLTKKGAGFRLMLWKHMDGAIEFANVGDKDELEIC